MYCQRLKRCVKITFVVAGPFALGIFLVLRLTATCYEKDAGDIIHTLCDDYANGHITGDLCPDLCIIHRLRHIECIRAQHGRVLQRGKKAVVFLGTLNGLNVTIKSKFATWRDAPPLNDQPHEQLVPDLDHLLLLKQAVVSSGKPIQRFKPNATYQLTLQDLVAFLNKDDADQTRATMQSMWSLLHQEEYVMLRSLQGSPFIPKLYGSCGHIFVVEYAGTVPILHPWHQFDVREKLLTLVSEPEEWNERARTAIKLMDLLKGLKTQFNEEVHSCDIHSNNFGVDANGTIKVIDADGLLFDSALRRWMGRKKGTPCKTHKECNVGTNCFGWCSPATGRCSGERTNDNFQALCHRLFQASKHNSYKGLLRSPPESIARDIEQLVDKCCNPFSPEKKSQVLVDAYQDKAPKLQALKADMDKLYMTLSGTHSAIEK